MAEEWRGAENPIRNSGRLFRQGTDERPHCRGMICPGDASTTSLLKTEGTGNAGCSAAPMARAKKEGREELRSAGPPQAPACNKKRRRQYHRFSQDNRHSLRDSVTAYT